MDKGNQMKDAVKKKQVIWNFIPDVPLSEQNCMFNVMLQRGKHRQCENYSRETVSGYGFCKRHAAFIRQKLGLAARVTTRGEGNLDA